ncbi:MAG: hypothetical protein ACFFCZ_20305 [Promethearchaeota archaeon]
MNDLAKIAYEFFISKKLGFRVIIKDAEDQQRFDRLEAEGRIKRDNLGRFAETGRSGERLGAIKRRESKKTIRDQKIRSEKIGTFPGARKQQELKETSKKIERALSKKVPKKTERKIAADIAKIKFATRAKAVKNIVAAIAISTGGFLYREFGKKEASKIVEKAISKHKRINRRTVESFANMKLENLDIDNINNMRKEFKNIITGNQFFIIDERRAHKMIDGICDSLVNKKRIFEDMIDNFGRDDVKKAPDIVFMEVSPGSFYGASYFPDEHEVVFGKTGLRNLVIDSDAIEFGEKVRNFSENILKHEIAHSVNFTNRKVAMKAAKEYKKYTGKMIGSELIVETHNKEIKWKINDIDYTGFPDIVYNSCFFSVKTEGLKQSLPKNYLNIIEKMYDDLAQLTYRIDKNQAKLDDLFDEMLKVPSGIDRDMELLRRGKIRDKIYKFNNILNNYRRKYERLDKKKKNLVFRHGGTLVMDSDEFYNFILSDRKNLYDNFKSLGIKDMRDLYGLKTVSEFHAVSIEKGRII